MYDHPFSEEPRAIARALALDRQQRHGWASRARAGAGSARLGASRFGKVGIGTAVRAWQGGESRGRGWRRWDRIGSSVMVRFALARSGCQGVARRQRKGPAWVALGWRGASALGASRPGIAAADRWVVVGLGLSRSPQSWLARNVRTSHGPARLAAQSRGTESQANQSPSLKLEGLALTGAGESRH